MIFFLQIYIWPANRGSIKCSRSACTQPTAKKIVQKASFDIAWHDEQCQHGNANRFRLHFPVHFQTYKFKEKYKKNLMIFIWFQLFLFGARLGSRYSYSVLGIRTSSYSSLEIRFPTISIQHQANWLLNLKLMISLADRSPFIHIFSLMTFPYQTFISNRDFLLLINNSFFSSLSK